jgi:hypothetical protein
MERARRWAATSESVSVITNAALVACESKKHEARTATIRAHSHRKPRAAMAQANAWVQGSEEGIKNSVARLLLDMRVDNAR